jgi:hypothetical protein
MLRFLPEPRSESNLDALETEDSFTPASGAAVCGLPSDASGGSD